MVVFLTAVASAGCVQETTVKPEWKVETVSAECATGEGDLDIRAVGTSIIITAPMQTSTPCYDAVADVTMDGNRIVVEIGAVTQGVICVECVGEVVGRVTISNLAAGSYTVDVRAREKAALTTILID